MQNRYDCFVSCASWAVMRRCDGNESGVGVGVGVGLIRSRNNTTTTSKLWQSSGVGDGITRSHGNESGVGVGVEFGATTTLQRCFLPYDTFYASYVSYHTMLLTICFLPPAANEATGRYASGDEASRRIFRTSAQFAFRFPLSRIEQRFILPKI